MVKRCGGDGMEDIGVNLVRGLYLVSFFFVFEFIIW